MERISWDELRTKLREDFEDPLTFVPQGDERVLFDKPETQIATLTMIATLVHTYLRRLPQDKVMEIVQREGGLTAILCGNETVLTWLHQHYID